MNRAVFGTVTIVGSGRPLVGLQVVAAAVEGEGLSPLACVTSGDFGRFRISYPEFSHPVDLTLLILDPDGGLLYVEPIHRSISGAELGVAVEVPAARLRAGLH